MNLCSYIAGQRVIVDVDLANQLGVTRSQLKRLCGTEGLLREPESTIKLTPSEKLVIAYQRKRQGVWSKNARPQTSFTAAGLALLLCSCRTSQSLSRKLVAVISAVYGETRLRGFVH